MSAGRHFINGVDLYSIGVKVTRQKGEKGSALRNALLKPPDSKQVYKKSWPDRTGTEVYVEQRVYAEKRVPMDFMIQASSEQEFWQRHKAFFDLVASGGMKRFYPAALKRSFFLYYDKCTGFTDLTGLGTSNIMMTGTVEFVEPVPSLWKEFTYLTDKDGNYLVNEDGSRLIV